MMEDANDDDVTPPAMRIPTTVPTMMPTTTPRGAQSQGRPGRLTSTAQGAYARRPPPTTATTTLTTPPTRHEAKGDRQGRRGNAGLRKACTRGGRPQERDGNVTATVLLQRDGTVTATAAMVGATTPRQRWRNCDTTGSKDNTCTDKAVSISETRLRRRGGANRQAGREHNGCSNEGACQGPDECPAT